MRNVATIIGMIAAGLVGITVGALMLVGAWVELADMIRVAGWPLGVLAGAWAALILGLMFSGD